MENVKYIIDDALNDKYTIPSFQREYSWDDKDIDEFIDDIINSQGDYCIGIITISNERNSKKLIDGQQRLTTIYMIAIACGILNKEKDINLIYETDRKLNKDNRLVSLLSLKKENDRNSFNSKFSYIKEIIKKENNKDKIKEKIKNVYYYEIDIDKKGKDLNHYFEVMNSRGVQLSRSDIIKSLFMQKLDSDNQKRLNNLWFMCENMKKFKYKYINFSDIPCRREYKEKSLLQILESQSKKNGKKEENNEEIDDNSILDFDYFLLYTIRLYRKIVSEKNNRKNEDNKLFELKNLVSDYRNTFENSDKNDVLEFLDFFIEVKNIYDRKIITNSYISSDGDSNWQIIDNNIKNKKGVISIQSCLRVSFTNRKQMNWLFDTLEYFIKNKSNSNYINYMRKIIRKEYVEDFIKFAEEKNYQTGFDTPHIILNYLDYLIKENYRSLKNEINELDKIKINEFKFKFRNSIEHFLPQINERKEEWFDDFGNLALLSYGTNTKMQNAEPDEKVEHFNKDLSGYSLKLQLMTLITKNNKEWTESKCEELRNVLFKLLKNDLKKGD